MDDNQLLMKARIRVAERYRQPYHKNAIMRGDWDKGSLINEELKLMEGKKK